MEGKEQQRSHTRQIIIAIPVPLVLIHSILQNIIITELRKKALGRLRVSKQEKEIVRCDDEKIRSLRTEHSIEI